MVLVYYIYGNPDSINLTYIPMLVPNCNLLSILLILLFSATQIQADEYVGSARCGECHEDKYSSWSESGHHSSLVRIEGFPPIYPFQYHGDPLNVPSPPIVSGEQLSWDDLSYIIGGYYREALFLGDDGYLITGEENDATRWHIWDQEWISMDSTEPWAMDCGKCHTTGYDPEGHQGDLPGIIGTWAEDGVGCEACHGPDS